MGLANQLHDFIASVPRKKNKTRPILSAFEERIYRSLKTHGEKSVKGRKVTKVVFEATDRRGLSFLMIMEGRHSMSVGTQVARRFIGANGIGDVDVVKTKNGACVIIRPRPIVEA